MSDYKIPWNELSGENNLKGTYKVTFLVEISDNDQMNLDDLHQAIASSVSGDPVLYKISKLELEKTDKQGRSLPPQATYKVGDIVEVSEDVEVNAKIEDYKGRLVVGSKNLKTELIGEGVLTVPAGSKARINKIDGKNVELIDFDCIMAASVNNVAANETVDVSVHVDSVIIPNVSIQPVTEGDDTIWP